MSNAQNDRLREQFMETLERVTVCPYCGDRKGDAYACCGENHFEEVWDDGYDYFSDDELEARFAKWCASLPEPDEPSPEEIKERRDLQGGEEDRS